MAFFILLLPALSLPADDDAAGVKLKRTAARVGLSEGPDGAAVEALPPTPPTPSKLRRLLPARGAARGAQHEAVVPISDGEASDVAPPPAGRAASGHGASGGRPTTSGGGGGRKGKVEWTRELHRRFVSAVERLGLDAAVPSRILDLMRVPTLTRHHIASHLQKYR